MQMASTLRSSARSGLIVGLAAIFIALIGMLEAFASRFLVGGITLTQVLLFGIGLAAGGLAIWQLQDRQDASVSRKLLAGAVGGLVCGLALAALLLIVANIDLGAVLVNATPELANILSFGLGPGLGAVALIVVFVVLALIAALFGLITGSIRKAIVQGIAAVLLVGLFWEVLVGLDISRLVLNAIAVKPGKVQPIWVAVVVFVVVAGITYLRSRIAGNGESKPITPTVAGMGRRNTADWIKLVAALAVVAALPFLVGLYWSQTLTTVGLFVLMGLGLNIVVGLAGLLDLGYVAFYAIGAYTMALLTSPASSLALAWPFWIVLPLSMLVAALAGILLGIPVLRLRGDYLAIVTLGFGEIIRILANSDLLKPLIGGPQGILETPAPVFFGFSLDDPRYLYYLILVASFVAAFVSTRLNHSRIGRAWIAMREDEDVAQAMGVHLVSSKLMAFSIGAAFAGIGGAIFASRQGAIFPTDFTLFISINVLCLIIIGGLGSIPGTIVGAFFLIGLPEVLREVDEYRILAYGAGLIIMMIVRPEGLLPSARRRLELHMQEEQTGPGPDILETPDPVLASPAPSDT